MSYFCKNKKMIVGILLVIIMISICYYIYSENSDFLNMQEQNLEVEEQEVENSNVESQNVSNEKISMIIVHISGAVKQEGIVELSENSRVADAIEKAGGLKEEACIDEINLAYVLEDGMKIHIPTIEEQKKNNEEEDNNNLYVTSSSGTNSATGESGGNNKKQTTKVNINTATQEELETLPGIGPSTALKIVNYRNENGKFETIEGIKEVNGIGDSKFNNIKDLICVK